MKKIIFIVLALLVAGGVGYSIYREKTKCDRAYNEYKKFLSSVDDHKFSSNSMYRWDVGRELDDRQSALSSLCYDKDHAHIAASMLERMIDRMNGPQYVLDKKLPRSSAQVRLVSLYYGRLAEVYSMQGREEDRVNAIKKKERYEAEASKLKD